MKWRGLRTRTMRALIACGVMGAILGLYSLRLFQLQVLQFDEWSRRSIQNHRTQHTLEMKRGTITDRNGVELALSVETYTVFLYTREIRSMQETAAQLSTILPMNTEEILAKVKGRKGYLPIFKNLERHLAMKINELNLPGVILEENYRRVYPQNALASNLLGFAGGEGHGLEGLELSFDRTLRGYAGLAVEEDVSTSEDGPGRMRIVRPPMGGSNMVLTIDSIIQHILETELAKLMEQWKPIDAMAIAMDPYTGEVLGMAVLPNYDLNKFADSPPEAHRNRPVTDLFEPGSCMKIFATACGLMSGTITSGTRFYCKGAGEVAGKRIKCHGSHGLVDIEEAIAESCNATMVQISQALDQRTLYRFYRQLGFGEPTGLEVPAETPGMFSSPSKWSALSAASLCIGQEIGVTGAQLVAAYSAIANGGRLLRPHLVRRIESPNGDLSEEFGPEEKRQVMPPELARRLRKMLAGVVDHGTGELAAVADYTVGGKTSTAQKANPAGGYFWDKVVTSFIGMGPAMNPRIVLFVAANEPRGDNRTLFGGKVAGPYFATMMDRILKYLKVPPDKGSHAVAATGTPIVTSLGTDVAVEQQAPPIKSVAHLPLSAFVPPASPSASGTQSGSFPLTCDLVPDFSGMTLKEVASLARHLDLEPTFDGNGIVVDQFPKPGASLAETRTVQVKFSPTPRP
ncbi:MAG TPA: penicillin-binding transpeptidase domain-containing protein [Candidatus Ozemobacteraceae bacterium]